MLYTACIVSLAFYWLLIETDYLRVNLHYSLPITPAVQSNILPVNPPNMITTAIESDNQCNDTQLTFNVPGLTPMPVKSDVLLLPEKCEVTLFYENFSSKSKRFNSENADFNKRKGYAPAYVQLSLDRHHFEINPATSEFYKIISEVKNSLNSKVPKTPVSAKASTHECIVPVEWIEAHKDDYQDCNGTIEITIDDSDKKLSLDDSSDKGVIKEFMSEFCKPAKRSRKALA